MALGPGCSARCASAGTLRCAGASGDHQVPVSRTWCAAALRMSLIAASQLRSGPGTPVVGDRGGESSRNQIVHRGKLSASSNSTSAQIGRSPSCSPSVGRTVPGAQVVLGHPSQPAGVLVAAHEGGVEGGGIGGRKGRPRRCGSRIRRLTSMRSTVEDDRRSRRSASTGRRM